MSVIRRIYLGFCILFMLTAVVGGIGYFPIEKQTDLNGETFTSVVPYVLAVKELKIEALMHFDQFC